MTLLPVGAAVGVPVGLGVGASVVIRHSKEEIMNERNVSILPVGAAVGVSVGEGVGVSVGAAVGVSVGEGVGVSVGEDVGVSAKAVVTIVRQYHQCISKCSSSVTNERKNERCGWETCPITGGCSCGYSRGCNCRCGRRGSCRCLQSMQPTTVNHLHRKPNKRFCTPVLAPP